MPQRIPQLDAVRGLAVLLVIVHNTNVFPSLHLTYIATYGWMGVDLFFALSGFLITGILLDTRKSQSYLRNFYLRRCLRIWPLYYTVLLFMFLVVPMAWPAHGPVIYARSSPWWAFLFFLQNFLVAIPSQAAGPLGVTWSLAIEELFYMVWPWIVRYSSFDRIKQIALSVIILSPALRYEMRLHHMHIYSNVFCRLDGLMAGALLAVFARSDSFNPGKYVRAGWAGLLVAAVLAVVTTNYGVRWLTFSMASLAAFFFVFLSLYCRNKWFQTLLKNRFLMYTGTISYGLYLLHRVPFDLVKTFQLEKHPFLGPVLTIGGSYALAMLSWTVLEQPFLKMKRFFDFQSSNPFWTKSPSIRISS